tara:strand:+ start:211 stop:1959 length:1749 start_codon:yes stop_codon:yes gene_type:complete
MIGWRKHSTITRGVVVPLPRKRKRGDTLTPSHILKVNPAKRSRRLLQDQWRVDPLILTYLTNALKGKRSPSISLKTLTKRSIDAMVQIAQSLPSSLKDSLTQENRYMALDHLLNETASTCTKHLPPVVRVIIDIVQYKNNKGPISLPSRCPLLDVDDSQQPAMASLYHLFGFNVLVSNTSHTRWKPSDDKKIVHTITYQADWETLPEPQFTGRAVDFLQKTMVHSSTMDSSTPIQPKLKKVLGFQSNVLAHILCPFRELRAPEFTQPIQTLIQLMLHFDDFNEKLGVHPAATRTHYDYLHALLFNSPTLETNFSDYSSKDDPYYRLFQKTVADIDRALEIKKVKKSLRHHWKDWLFNHFKSTIAEREFKEQLKYTRASNERLLDTYFKIRLDTIGIGALFTLILSYSGIDTTTPEIERMIIALCLLNSTSNDLLSGLKEYYDAIKATVPSDEFSSLWTEDFLDLTMADIKKHTQKYRPTFEANAPYLFTRAVPKATIRDGFVSTSLLHHRLLEQLQSMLQDFKPEKFNMAQRHALLVIIDATIGRATTGTASKTQLPKDIIHCTAASKMRYTNEAQFLPATG